MDESVFNGNTYWYKLVDVDVNGVRTDHPVISAVPHISSADLGVIDNGELPKEFALKGNYPNPFNPTTTVSFNIIEAVPVRLEIYNKLGQKIQSQQFENYSVGEKATISVNMVNNPIGIYFLAVSNGRSSKTHKLLLLR